MVKCFKDSINELKKDGATNIMDFLKKNGTCVMIPYVYDKNAGDGAATFDVFGVIAFNFDQKAYKLDGNKGISYMFKRALIGESLGSGYYRLKGLEGEYTKANFYYTGLIKSGLAEKCAKVLQKKSGKKDYDILYAQYYAGMVDWYAKTGKMSANDPGVLAEMKRIEDGNLLPALGEDTWQEIDAMINKK
jgi:hypothetical protein